MVEQFQKVEEASRWLSSYLERFSPEYIAAWIEIHWFRTLHNIRAVNLTTRNPNTDYMIPHLNEILSRAFFGLSFVLVLLLSIYFISNVYVRWSSTPIIVTLSAKSVTITSIPFPTVTICNLNRGLTIATFFHFAVLN